MTQLTKRYIDAAGVGKSGACHIFRPSMATHMLEAGCDVRLLQEILGHVEMSTTAIYTRVSIKHLKRVHEQTHPAAHLDPKRRLMADDGGATPQDGLLAAADADVAIDGDDRYT